MRLFLFLYANDYFLSYTLRKCLAISLLNHHYISLIQLRSRHFIIQSVLGEVCNTQEQFQLAQGERTPADASSYLTTPRNRTCTPANNIHCISHRHCRIVRYIQHRPVDSCESMVPRPKVSPQGSRLPVLDLQSPTSAVRVQNRDLFPSRCTWTCDAANLETGATCRSKTRVCSCRTSTQHFCRIPGIYRISGHHP